MTDGPASAGESPIELDAWIWTRPLPEVVRRMQAIREGARARPASAMRILQTFAERRSIDDLLQLEPVNDARGHFDRLDAAAILALAALKRDVRDAAQLTIRRWEIERNTGRETDTPLTNGIIHDVTAQRTVREVADFIIVCCGDGHEELVVKIVEAFAGHGSGRSNFDKALLYLALEDRGQERQASQLLGLVLQQTEHPARVPVDRVPLPARQGIVAAFRHLSPLNPIVEDQLALKASSITSEGDAIRIAANLLIEDPPGARSLARAIGHDWKPIHLVKLCEILSKELEAAYRTVRLHAAERQDTHSLFEIIREWHLSGVLSDELMELLADIVAPEAREEPRDIQFLNELSQTLNQRNVHAECVSQLQIAVARHVYGRSGADIAMLLGRVRGRADQRRTARTVNRRLARGLFSGGISTDVVIDYFTGLQRQPASSSLIFSAVRELADPVREIPPEVMASWIADAAIRLHGVPNLDRWAFDLLERFLENEQFVTAQAVVEISERVATDGSHLTGTDGVTSRPMSQDPRWRALLSSTVGRWAEVRRREEAIGALHHAGLPEDGNAIIS